MAKLQIVYKKVDDLIPYINNSRTHSEAQVLQIASSIKEFGFTNPILLDKENGILAGHGRIEAARKLHLNEVPTIDLSHLTPSQRKAYIIADNKLALNAGWDEEILKLELQELSDTELQLTGFSEAELELLMNGWNSDIEIPEKEVDFSSQAQMKLKFAKEDYEQAKELITNALDDAGIEYEF